MTQIENERSRRRLRPGLLALAAATLVVTVVSGPRSGEAQEELDASKIQDTRDAFAQWAETRRTISKVKAAWKEDQVVLADQIELRKEEIAGLRERIAESKKSRATADRKKAELTAKLDGLKADAEEFERVIDELEPRVLALVERFPDPLREEVAKSLQAIPRNDDEKEKLSLGQRYANVATVMIKANKFNREIKIESENREVENGTTVATRVIYFGFGQGYYVSQNGDIGGIGTSTDKGWIWVPRNDVASGIAQAIDAKTNKGPASFVKLPVLIDGKEVK